MYMVPLIPRIDHDECNDTGRRAEYVNDDDNWYEQNNIERKKKKKKDSNTFLYQQ